MKLIYHGEMSEGATSLHRYEAFAALEGVSAEANDLHIHPHPRRGLISRALWRARWPIDSNHENERLIAHAAEFRPDIVFVDNSRVIRRETLRRLRKLGAKLLAYYSPDDLGRTHNRSVHVALAMPRWDIVFTTKTFNVAELAKFGARAPKLVGNAFHPAVHKPLSAAEVGPEFEAFDAVFVGIFERARARSIRRLAEAGLRVVVYGDDAGPSQGSWRSLSHPNIARRPGVYGAAYTRAMHHGKIGLCFLRKRNRDRITSRSIEIPAMARPMLAEASDEHEAYFRAGQEAMFFADDDGLVIKAKVLLQDGRLRRQIAEAGRARCLSSGYSTQARVQDMLDLMRAAMEARQTAPAARTPVTL